MSLSDEQEQLKQGTQEMLHLTSELEYAVIAERLAKAGVQMPASAEQVFRTLFTRYRAVVCQLLKRIVLPMSECQDGSVEMRENLVKLIATVHDWLALSGEDEGKLRQSYRQELGQLAENSADDLLLDIMIHTHKAADLLMTWLEGKKS